MSEPYELTDEEMEELLGEDFRTAYSGHVAEYHAIAEAQRKLLLKYLCGRCTEHTELEVLITRRCCPDCIAKLLKAHGEE